jgi:septal ring factor EnvC (AmiA/AmiB activator)
MTWIGKTCAGALCCLTASALVAAESSVTIVRETLAQWVQTRQLISRTEADWNADKETLQQSKALYERELSSVQAQLARISTNSTVANRERLTAEADLKEMTAGVDAARTTVARLEAEVRSILPLLPPPLKAATQPLVDRLPADSAATKAVATERLQTVVSLLNEIDKFHNTLTIANEKQPNAKGELISVDVIYVGLATAYFVDASGTVAGIGSPGDAGWTWQLKPEIGPLVRDSIAMYRSQKPAAFVGLPAAIR